MVSIGEDQSFVNSGSQRNGENKDLEARNEQGNGLEAMSHDEGALGVVLGFLMKLFDRRHAATLLGHLEAVGDADGIVSDSKGAKDLQDQRDPELSEFLEAEGVTVEEVEEAGIGVWFQCQGSDEASNSKFVEAHGQTDEDNNHPSEG